jgi:hypothetical protein
MGMPIIRNLTLRTAKCRASDNPYGPAPMIVTSESKNFLSFLTCRDRLGEVRRIILFLPVGPPPIAEEFANSRREQNANTVGGWSRSFAEMSVSSIHPEPTVVFVDDAQWECFFHLAAILRKEGIRTVRVSVGLNGWQGNRLLFDRHVSLLAPPTPEQLSAILSSEYVTDVQPTESLAMVTYAALDLLPASQRSDTWLGRPALLDKWRIASDLRDLGLRTPDTLLVELVTPAKAVEKPSLPIVVKRRVSSGGL